MYRSHPWIRTALLSLWGLTSLAGCAGESVVRQESSKSKLVVISVDSLQPDFYLSPASPAETLKSLATKGAFARQIESIYPSVTYPVHVSLVTGVKSDRHGVLSNKVFDPVKGPTQAWYWNASSIRVPTLWDQVRASGKTVALLGWPATVGARADWLVPEVFPEKGFDPATIWQETVKATESRFLSELPEGPFRGTLHRDEWITDSAIRTLKNHSPDVTLLHLSHVDIVQHLQGPGTPASLQALKEVDLLVARVASSLDLSRDCLMIVGDHGFASVRKLIRLNSLFRERGWITPSGWKVMAGVSGGQAAVYVKDPNKAFRKEVLQVLNSHAGGRYQVIQKLSELGAFPGAWVAIEPEPGFAISGEDTGKFVEEITTPRGEHGFLPTRPDMATGFIATGACARAGVQIERGTVLDVATTIAETAGVSLPEGEGKAFRLK